MKRLFILLLIIPILGLIPQVYAQHRSLVQQEIIQIPGIKQPEQVSALDRAQKQTVRSYKDGLGRTIQTVSVGASPQEHDIIGIQTYDRLGREDKVYLPYTGNDASGGF